MKTGPYLLRMTAVMGPAFLLNERVGMAYALVWVVACLMILLALPNSAWIRR